MTNQIIRDQLRSMLDHSLGARAAGAAAPRSAIAFYPATAPASFPAMNTTRRWRKSDDRHLFHEIYLP